MLEDQGEEFVEIQRKGVELLIPNPCATTINLRKKRGANTDPAFFS
jgi:hypothetical protein